MFTFCSWVLCRFQGPSSAAGGAQTAPATATRAGPSAMHAAGASGTALPDGAMLTSVPPSGLDPKALHAALRAQLPVLYVDLLLGFDEVSRGSNPCTHTKRLGLTHGSPACNAMLGSTPAMFLALWMGGVEEGMRFMQHLMQYVYSQYHQNLTCSQLGNSVVTPGELLPPA